MPKASSSIQALYSLCKNTFTLSKASHPSSEAVLKICSLMDTIGLSDVGLKEENLEDDRGHGVFGMSMFSRAARWAQPISYIDVYECDSFTMCIFCLPTSSTLPLHDHPGMSVFSKVLYGSMHVKSYDWVEPARFKTIKKPQTLTVRLAKLAVDKVLTASTATSVLFPRKGGNIHCFTAVAPCAVLDILAPPYQEAAGRKCTYYHDYPFSSFSAGLEGEVADGEEEEYAWLAEIETPQDLYMRQGTYAGPKIEP